MNLKKFRLPRLIKYPAKFLPSFLPKLTRTRLMPDFFIPGPMRSGTTSLFLWVIAHPEIGIPLVKENYFWNQPKVSAWNDYQANFLGKLLAPDLIIPDACPQYLCSPFSLLRICKHVTKPKLICILRNPFDRTRSSYWHAVKYGWFQGSFDVALRLEKRLFPSLEEACHLEWRSTYRAFLENAHVWQSRYAWQLQAIPSQAKTLVLFLEDMVERPQDSWERICDFLEVGRTVAPPLPLLNAGCNIRVSFPEDIKNFFRQDLVDLQRLGLKPPWTTQLS